MNFNIGTLFRPFEQVLAKQRQILVAALLALFATLGVAGTSEAKEAYRLHSGDRIALRIVTWNSIDLNFVAYEALGGEYGVGSDGTVMIPMLGPVEAATMTVSDLAEVISAALQERLGLEESPGTSVAVVSYRPIYILGAVRDPGPYPFTPGLTVQQAIALAGGADPLLGGESSGVERVIRTEGTLRELNVNLIRAKVRAARLQAEMDGGQSIELGDDLRHPDGPEGLAALLESETRLFEGRREALQRSLDALDASRRLLETESVALDGKGAGQDRQMVILRQRTDNFESLVQQGLARAQELGMLQSQIIDLENRQLDTETAGFRARQSLAELDRERIDIEAERKLEIMRQLQETQALIDQLTERRATTARLLSGAQTDLADIDQPKEFTLLPTITREIDAERTTLSVDAGTQLSPADVLELAVQTTE